MIEANDPHLKSWMEVTHNSDFPIQNLPFGIFSVGEGKRKAGSAIGDYVIDLEQMAHLGYFEGLPFDSKLVFGSPSLNSFLDLGKEIWSAVRLQLSQLLREGNERLKKNHEHRDKIFLHKSNVKMHLPVQVGDYTDFYSSIEHATNVGKMFRPDNPLLPNWRNMPIAYHGRASSIVISGTPIHRPKGQIKPANSENPLFSESEMLDFELELAFVIGGQTSLGQRVSASEAENFIFGFLLFNDWSARDIQSWEYQPLGPFLSKNFASSVSPWIVTLEALEPFRCAGPKQEPEPLPYLQTNGNFNFDIELEVDIKNTGFQKTITHSNTKYLYWNCRQQLAHHTVSGCPLRSGDLCASGTISGPTEKSLGSLLEITKRGATPLEFPDGSKRAFLLDGDQVIMRGFAKNKQYKIGFGECVGLILPAII